jgi:GNAT superfamily N-acetyltransferase
VDRAQTARVQAVEPLFADLPYSDQLNLAEHAEMLGSAGLSDPQFRRQLQDRTLALFQQLKDVAALRFGDRIERVGGRRGSGHDRIICLYRHASTLAGSPAAGVSGRSVGTAGRNLGSFGVIERLDGDQLREATGDDPMAKAVVLGSRMIGKGWSGFGAYVWQGTHRGQPSLNGIGSPSGAARLVEAIVSDHPAVRHVSMPRGWLEHTTPGLALRKADWDWFWTENAPKVRPPVGRIAWLTAQDEEDVRGLLEQAMPDAAAWPGDARVRRWSGIRDADLRLVACAADTSRSPAVGHMSSVTTATDQRRKGYAAALVGWMASQYLDDGMELVTLGMYADNTAARRLYSQLGFSCRHRFTSAGINHH